MLLLLNGSRESGQSSVAAENWHGITGARSISVLVTLKFQKNQEWPQVIPNKSWVILLYSPYQCPVTSSASYSLTICTGWVNMCWSTKDFTKISLLHPDLIKIFCCRPHFFPGLVQQLDTDGKQLLKCTVMSEKHGVIVIPAFIGFRKKQTTTTWAYWTKGTRSN